MRFSIRLALAGTLGVIIAITAAALVLVLESGRQNTIALVQDRSERIIDSIIQRIRLHLDPARDQSEFLANLIRDGKLDPYDETAFLLHLRAALSGTPQVVALSVIRTDLEQLRVEQHGDEVVMRTIDMKSVPGLTDAFKMAQEAAKPIWGELLWSARLNQPLVNVRTPIWQNNSFVGIMLVTVTVGELSQFLADSPGSATGAFILYGHDQVLAHEALAHTPSLFKPDQPLPKLTEIGDPVLASIWNADRDTGVTNLASSSESHAVSVDGVSHAFIYRAVTGYSDQSWLVGRHLPLTELETEVRRLENTAWIALFAVLTAIACAWLVGYTIGKPILRLARATAAVRTLDLAAARPLSSSRFRELDEAINAYNALVASLHWFETYVPKHLVKRLMAQGEKATALEEREVTVLFTDIVQFASIAERLSGSDTAAFLNCHFALLAARIEAEDGTIDKFIGDSLMAFWGAPELQPDHAARACRAARAIAIAIVDDNRHQRRMNIGPVRIRIGIHTGRAIVGNIGAPGRINYTLVGDVVNMAQRIQEVARESMTEKEEAVVFVSEAVVQSVGPNCIARSIGARTLRGRTKATNIFRLL